MQPFHDIYNLKFMLKHLYCLAYIDVFILIFIELIFLNTLILVINKIPRVKKTCRIKKPQHCCYGLYEKSKGYRLIYYFFGNNAIVF